MNLDQSKLSVAIATALAMVGCAGLTVSTQAFAESMNANGQTLQSDFNSILSAASTVPIDILTRADIEAQGATSLGELLGKLNFAGSAFNALGNNGGIGDLQFDARNFGARRTLILLNGRPWLASYGLSGATDLSSIPLAFVERIEILKSGAAADYGSAAIAAVVNVVLQGPFNGAKANLQWGQYDKGDGARQAADFTMSASGERYQALFGIAHVEEDAVRAGDREISAEPIFRTGNLFGSSTPPGGRFAVCNGSFNASTGVCLGTQTRPDGSAGQFTYDPGRDGTQWRNWDVSQDIYNPAPENNLRTPQERVSAYMRADLEFNDHLNLSTQVLYNERKSEQLLAPVQLILGTGPGASGMARAAVIDANSIYNPFGRTVTRIQRRMLEAGPRRFTQDVDGLAWDLHLDGLWQWGEHSIDWTLGFQSNEVESNNRSMGLLNVLAIQQALGPSFRDPNGVARCGTPSSVVAGCVPLNLLGGVGAVDQAMLDYIGFVGHDMAAIEDRIGYFNARGDAWELPAGPVQWHLGLMQRRESARTQPDAFLSSGNATGLSEGEIDGARNTQDVNLGLVFPLMHQQKLAEELHVSLSGRVSDSNDFARANASRIGLFWQPHAGLQFQAQQTKDFRHPGMDQLFLTGISGFGNLRDPCVTGSTGFSSLNQAGQNRCTAVGVPAGGYSATNTLTTISGGGNQVLGAERSSTDSLSMHWQPTSVPELELQVQWWKTQANGLIQAIGAQALLDQCIRIGDAEACAMIERAPNGALMAVHNLPLNRGRLDAEGIDWQVNYRFPEFRWGQLTLRWHNANSLNYEIDRDDNNLVGEHLISDNHWRWRSNLVLDWRQGDFSSQWNARYYSAQEEACPFAVNDYGFGILCNRPIYTNATTQELDTEQSRNRLAATVYHDVSVAWSAPWNASLRVGIQNLFDQDPPVSYQSTVSSFDPQYEIPGRFWYLRYSQEF